jgi:sigma-B regulation protein RsbU (phosphoserine phosphatase)
MRVDSKSLTTFFRDQGIYLCLALVVGAIFWSIGQPVNPFTVLLYSLCIGNFLSPPMQWLHALYEKPAPYDWIIFLVLLCIVTVPVYLLSTVIVWLIAPPTTQSLGHLITTGWKMPFLITIVYGLMNFLYERSKARLERRNVELQSMVQAGAARLEIQDEELQRAREIQESLLPKEIPQLPGFEVASAWQPARAVGGDYFDVLKLGQNRLAICIADVSGKGVPAALLMANVQASLRASVRDLDSPARVCSMINGMLCESIAADKFVTFFCGVLDTASRTFRYCNAGHPYPILVSSGALCTLDQGGAWGFSRLDVSGLERGAELRRQAAPIYRWYYRSRGTARRRIRHGKSCRIRQSACGEFRREDESAAAGAGNGVLRRAISG